MAAQQAPPNSAAATIPRQSPDLWLKALNSLDDSLKAELDFQNITHLNIPRTLLRIVQDKKRICIKKSWKYRKANGEEIVLRDVLEKIARWLEKFRAVGDSVIQYDPAHAALPWAGIRFLVQVVVNDTEVFATTLLGVETIAHLITRYAIFEELYLRRDYNGRSELENLLLDLYKEILIFLAKARKYFRARTAVRVLKSVFHAAESDQLQKIEDAEARVTHFVEIIDTELQIDIQRGVTSVLQLLGDLKAPMTRLVDVAFLFEKSLEESKYLEILNWISSVPYFRHHQQHSGERLSKTGKWLLQHPEYCSWLASSSSSILLVHGIRGSGKTALVSAVVDSLLTNSSVQSSPAPVAYFYCARNPAEPERANPEEITRSILRQLAISREPNRTINQGLLTEFERRKAEAKLDGFDMVKLGAEECLKVILEITYFNPLTIVIDAIDEIDEDHRYDLLSVLKRLQEGSASLIKIILTARDNQDVFNLLPDSQRIRITSKGNREDVELFAKHQVSLSKERGRLLGGRLSADLMNTLVNALIEGAQEMFLWIKLQVQHLCQFELESDVRAAMQRLSERTLQELYAETFHRVFDAHSNARKVALRVFSWLMCMKESLGPAAILSAALQLEEDQSDHLDIPKLLEICHDLIIHDTSLDVLRFAHISAQEFLHGKKDFCFTNVNRLVALDCLKICSGGPTYPIETRSEPENQGLYLYATSYWPVHCKAADIVGNNDGVWHVMRDFVFSGADISLPFLVWLDAIQGIAESLPRDHHLKKSLGAVSNSQQSPIFTSCAFGLEELVIHLSSFGNTDWNQVNDLGQSGLYLAAAAGHYAIVCTLIELGADTNVAGGRYTHPLHAACFSGHLSVVQVLLDNGANSKLRGTFANAFLAALAGGNEEIALLLLKDDHFCIADQSEYDCALTQAAQTGLMNVIQTLETAYKSTFSASTESKKKSILDPAIYKGQLRVVEYFLESRLGTDLSLPRDALSKAAFGGHNEMVSFLVGKGLDLEVEGTFGNPLRVSSLMGHDSTVRLLLNEGAAINTSSAFGSPLQASAMNGHLSIIKLLIEERADVNSTGGFFGTALQAAAYRGHLAVVEALLDADANVYQEGFSEDAFHAAAEGGHEDIIHYLLKRGYSAPQHIPPSLCYRCIPPQPPFDLMRASSPSAEQVTRDRRFKSNNITSVGCPAYAYVADFQDIRGLVKNGNGGNTTRPPNPYSQPRYGHDKQNYMLEAAALVGNGAIVSSILGECQRRERRTGYDMVCGLTSWGSPGIALENAAANGHEFVVRLLISCNLDISSGMHLSLQRSAQAGHLSIVKLLLTHERNLPLSRDSIGWIERGRELHHPGFSAEGDQEGRRQRRSALYRLGFSAGGDRNEFETKDQREKSRLETVLLAACRGEHLTILDFVLSLFRERYSEDDRQKMLCKAAVQSACGGQSAVMRSILARGLSVTQDLLHQAFEGSCLVADRQSLSLVIALDQSGCLKAEMYQKGLEICVRDNSYELIGDLFHHDLSLHDLCITEVMILFASGNGYLDTLNILVKERRHRGLPLDILDQSLNIACANGHQDVVEFLIECKANIGVVVKRLQPDLLRATSETCPFPKELDFETQTGQTKYNALQAAIHGNERFLSRERHRHLLVSGDFEQADEDSQEAVILYLIEKGADVNDLGGCSDVPLICAANNCSKRVVAKILDKCTGSKALGYTENEGCAPNSNTTSGKALATDISKPIPISDAETELETLPMHTDMAYKTSGSHEHGSNDVHILALQNVLDLFDYGRSGRESTTIDEILEKGPGAVIELLLSSLPEERAVDEKYNLLLQMAARNGKDKTVKLLLERGADANAIGCYYGTALQAAARFGQIEAVALLLHSGAEVNILEGVHGTALRASVYGGHIKVAEILMEHGSDPNLRPKGAESIVQLALGNVQESISGAYVNTRERLGPHNFAHAPRYLPSKIAGNVSLIQSFLAKGADPNAIAEDSRISSEQCYIDVVSPLQKASAKGQQAIVELLVHHGALVEDSVGEDISPLQLAARSGHTSVVRFLIDKCANVNRVLQRSGIANTALTLASGNGDAEIVEELLRAGAIISDGPNIPNALIAACRKGKYVVASMLLEELSRSHLRAHARSDALAEACQDDDNAGFGFLLEHMLPFGCDGYDEAADHALQVSAHHLRPHFVQQLIEHGAMEHSQNGNHGSPIIAALLGCADWSLTYRSVEKHDRAFVETFLPETSRRGEPYLYEIPSASEKLALCKRIIEILVNYGADVNTELREFGNAIHVAAFIGDIPLMQLLLQEGGDLHVRGGWFGSTLLAAIAGGNLAMVALMLEHNVDVRYLSSQGRSALQYAFLSMNYEAVQMLLEKGANINGIDGEASSPLAAALTSVDLNRDAQKSADLIEILVRDQHMLEIKEADLIALAGTDAGQASHRSGVPIEKVLNLLRSRGRHQITESVLEAIVHPDVLRLLLKQESVCAITPRIVEKAASRMEHGLELTQIFMLHSEEFPVSEDLIARVLEASYSCRTEAEQRQSENILRDLLSRNKNLRISDEMLQKVRSPEAMQILLRHVPNHPVSSKILETVAKKHRSYTKKLPDGSTIPFGGCYPVQCLLVKTLLEHDKKAKIMPTVVHEACESPDYFEFLKVLLEHDPELVIAENDFVALLRRSPLMFEDGFHLREHLVSLLMEYDKKLPFTDKIRQAIDFDLNRFPNSKLKALHYQLEKQD
ncbi:MAG: hypothetical protein M1820_008650 [Bogoriella megaspora]|nr:MAG: hypothetical protein M1820_008650 [Bogoriella megaspora]